MVAGWWSEALRAGTTGWRNYDTTAIKKASRRDAGNALRPHALPHHKYLSSYSTSPRFNIARYSS